MKLKYFR